MSRKYWGALPYSLKYCFSFCGVGGGGDSPGHTASCRVWLSGKLRWKSLSFS